MQQSRTKALIFGIGLLGSTALAGCGSAVHNPSAATHPPSSHQTSPTTQSSPSASASESRSGVKPGTPVAAKSLPSTTASAPRSPFPAIIQMAMSPVPNGLVPSPMAPTKIPPEPSGSTSMFFDPTILKSPASYTIRLSAPHHALASFGASSYSTAQQAADAAGVNQYAQGPAGTVAGHQELSPNITATIVKYAVSHPKSAMVDKPWEAVQWKEGRWTIQVTNYAQATVPTKAAQAMVAALNKYYLPAPQISGNIYVSLWQPPDQASPTMEVDVQWEEGSMEYQVDAYNATPINTAVSMAVSMRAYPSNQN